VAVNPLRFLAGLLDAAGIEYALIGGHAVNTWLEPRFTADVDLTIEAGVERMDRLAEILLESGFEQDSLEGADQSSGPDFARFTSSNPQLVLEFQAAKTALQESVIARARTTEYGLRVATPEDLIILKLIANRPKDRIDSMGLCALPGLDWDYLREWARRWDVEALLEELRREGGGG